MKKTLNNILNYINKFTMIFTIICLSIATFGAIFLYTNRSYNYFNPVVLIFLTIISILFIFKLYSYIKKLNNKQKKIISIILLITQFILLFISSQIISSKPQVDLIEILAEVNNLNKTGNIFDIDYFSIYQNNNFLVVLLYGISKLSPNNYEIIFDLTSCLCISIMSFFTYKTTQKVFDDNKALLTLFFCVSSPIFYLYVSYYYTDIFMLPFASILIYLIVINKNKENFKAGLLNSIYIGIIAAIGYKIRAVSIFLLIAYFVYLIFEKKFNKTIKTFIPIIISLILSLNLITIIEHKVFKNLDNSKKMPATHWIMMGVHAKKNGYYFQDDFLLSTSLKTPEETKKVNIDITLKRIKNQGFIKNITLLGKKLIVVWSRGDYSYQKYLTHVKDFNISYRYLMEDKNIIINYVLQASKIVFLLLTISSISILLKQKKSSIIGISLFGAIVFYLIWEVCPRYGLSFLPWMILIANYSYDIFNTNLNKYHSFKYFKECLVIITIIILGIGFVKYTNIEERTSIISKNNIETRSAGKCIRYIQLKKGTILTQGIKLYDNWNELNLKFKFLEKDQDKDFTLELLNNKDEIIYQKNILISDLMNEKYTSFKLDKTYPKGIYTIKLSINKETSLEIYSNYEEGYDFYSKGKLIINDNEENKDILFEIKNIENRRIFSYIEYISLIIITLGSEYLILFKERRKNK